MPGTAAKNGTPKANEPSRPGALDHAGAAVEGPAREVGDLRGRAAVRRGELLQRDRAGDRRGAAAARGAAIRRSSASWPGLWEACALRRGRAAVAEHDQLGALRPHLERLAAGARRPAPRGRADPGRRPAGRAGELGAGVGRRAPARGHARVDEAQPAAGDPVDALLGLQLEAGRGLDREPAGAELDGACRGAGGEQRGGEESGRERGEEASVRACAKLSGLRSVALLAGPRVDDYPGARERAAQPAPRRPGRSTRSARPPWASARSRRTPSGRGSCLRSRCST